MNPHKKQIEDYIIGHKEEMLEKLETFVRIESQSDERENVEQCTAWFAKELEAEGFVCKLHETPGERAGVLVAILGEERQGAPVIFSGHTDTVHPTGSFGADPFKIEDGKMFGPGVLDMKGGLIIALYVVKALNSVGYNERPIKMIISGDEERGHAGTHVDELYTAESKGAVCALNMETGQMGNRLCIRRKGQYNIFANIKGIGGHSGNHMETGRNAVHEAALKVVNMIAMTDMEKGTTVNTSILQGGDVPSKIPDFCKLTMDMRYVVPEEGERLFDGATKIMNTDYIEGTHTVYRIEAPMFQPLHDTEDVWKFLNFSNKVASENGLKEFGTLMLGACSDAGNIQAAGVPVLDCCGVVGEFNHSLQEYAFVDSLYERTEIWALVILELNNF